MKVLYILSGYSTAGGTSAKIFCMLKHSRFNSIVVAPNNACDKQYIEMWKCANVDIRPYPSNCNFYVRIRHILKIMRSEPIGIVHSFFPDGFIISSIAKALGNNGVKMIRSYEGAVRRKLSVRLFEKIAMSYCDQIISISKYIESFYIKPIGKKPHIVIDNPAAHIVQVDSPKERCSSPVKLLSISGLNANKNVLIFPEIAKELKKQGLNFIIEICGDGPQRQELEEKIKYYGIEKELVLLGYVPDPTTKLIEADIYLHPATNEGFGMSVAEAMAACIPVVVANKGGLPELVNNGIDGIICAAESANQWSKAILTIVNDDALRKKLAQSGHDVYKKRFTPESYAKKLDNLYESI